MKSTLPTMAAGRSAGLLEPLRRATHPRAFATSFVAALCAGVVAAPVLVASGAPLWSGLLYLAYAPICHQNPDRSFAMLGHAWAVCHRCSGIYLGLLAGLLFPSAVSDSILRRRRTWAVGAVAIVVADFLAGASQLIPNTPWSRFASGIVFGTVASVFVLRGISEFLSSRFASPAVHALDGEIR